jgi:hypothetical protein
MMLPEAAAVAVDVPKDYDRINLKHIDYGIDKICMHAYNKQYNIFCKYDCIINCL